MRTEGRWVIVVLAVLGSVSAGAGEVPVAVSPGDTSKLARIGDPCPTFSWGGLAGTEVYELVVYRLGEEGQEATPVLREKIPGSALAWTPSLDQCLERGGRYAWSVRAVGSERLSDWSAPSLFEVASGPSAAEFEAALQVVRQYLGEQATGRVEGAVDGARSPSGSSATPVLGSAGEVAVGATPLSVAAGDTALQVNGSPVVTVATLKGALCIGLDLRYVDQGDGTVLDCNTGLIWLKNAGCFGPRTWDDATSDAAGLENGECGLTDGSSPGHWRLPTVGEFCSASLPFGGICPTANAADSLIDSAVGPPTVVNARGDGAWSQGDPFVDVQFNQYWSATPFGTPGSYWWGDLRNGEVGTFDGASLHVWPVRDP